QRAAGEADGRRRLGAAEQEQRGGAPRSLLDLERHLTARLAGGLRQLRHEPAAPRAPGAERHAARRTEADVVERDDVVDRGASAGDEDEARAREARGEREG